MILDPADPIVAAWLRGETEQAAARRAAEPCSRESHWASLSRARRNLRKGAPLTPGQAAALERDARERAERRRRTEERARAGLEIAPGVAAKILRILAARRREAKASCLRATIDGSHERHSGRPQTQKEVQGV